MRYKIVFKLLCLFLTFFTFDQKGLSENKNISDSLVIKVYNNFYPYSFIDDSGKIDGFFVDFFSEVMERLNVNYKFQISDWRVIGDNEKNESVDIYSGVMYLENPKGNISLGFPYSDMLLDMNIVTYSKKGIVDLKNIYNSDLLIEDKFFDVFFSKKLFPNSKIVRVENVDEALEMLSQEKYDFFISYSNFIRQTILNKKRHTFFTVSSFPSEILRFTYAVSNERIDLLEKINLVYLDMLDDGFYDSILFKWGIHPEWKILPINYRIIIIEISFFLMTLILTLVSVRIQIKIDKKDTLFKKVMTRLILNSMPLIITVVENKKDGKSKYMNKKALEFFRDQNNDKSKELYDESKYDIFKKRIKGLEENENFIRFQKRVEYKGGMKKDFLIQQSIVWYGKESFIFSLYTDITEQIVLNEKAIEDNRRKSEFLESMSHEIRTPLNAIVGFSDLLVEAESQEETKLANDIIEKNNDVLLKLINDILLISKLDSGVKNIPMRKLDFISFMEGIYETYRKKVKENVEFIVDYDYSLLEIETDKKYLENLIKNIVDNAIKFTEKGSVKINFYVKNDLLFFFIKDTGSGIKKERIASIFNRFEKEDVFKNGIGLGMSISDAIVKMFKGKIGVASDIGKGTLVWFEIRVKSNYVIKDNCVISDLYREERKSGFVNNYFLE